MKEQINDQGKDWPQILTIILACIPGITSGLIFSWSTPFILTLIHDKENYDISEDEANLLPVLLPIGITIFALFFFKIHDLIGRKYTMLLIAIPQAAYWIITIWAKNIYSFYVARIIGGCGDALMYAVLPIYVGEIATPRVRGTWGTGQTFSFNVGFTMIAALGSYLTVQQTAYICLIFPILFLALFIWMPETPYYYVMKGEDVKAKASLQWLLRKDNIEPDFLQLKADVQRQISETGTWADLYKITSNRKALIVVIFLRISQAFAGISTFETYFQYIFEKSGTTFMTPELSSITFALALWIVATGFTFTLDKFGRRKSFIYSSLGCSIALLVESIYFYLNEFNTDIDLTNVQWIPLVGLMFYIFFFCSGLGLIPSLMTGELFSVSIKGKALALSGLALGIILTGATYTFKSLNSTFGLFAPFLVFAICTFLSFISAFFIIPETRGKTLEEIQQLLKGNNKIKITEK